MPETNTLPPGLELRRATGSDAAAVLALGRQLLDETDGFVRTPAERAQNLADMRAVVARYAANPGWAMLHVWDATDAVGEAVLSAGHLVRTAHIGTLGIGVLQTYWGQGIGRALMLALEAIARNASLERLEFTVLSHNERARDFYRRLGYVEEGIRTRSVRYGPVPGGAIRYGDEITMAKWIGSEDCIVIGTDDTAHR